MIKELFVRKPKIRVRDIASAVFERFFTDEIIHTFKKIRKDVTNVRREKLTLTIIALFVFIVDHSTFSVYGNSKSGHKILKAFYALIKQEYKADYNFIIELSQKFRDVYYSKPEDPLFGLGMSFSKCINPKNDYCNLLTAMTGTTETAKKSRMLIKYYQQVKGDYRII
jgi:hypothetical protein